MHPVILISGLLCITAGVLGIVFRGQIFEWGDRVLAGIASRRESISSGIMRYRKGLLPNIVLLAAFFLLFGVFVLFIGPIVS